MFTTQAVRKKNIAEQPAKASRSEVLARYRRLREFSAMHHSEAMKFLAKDAVLQQARRLGLAAGKTLMLESMDELTLAFDLAIYTARAGRSRALDRYARTTRFAPGSDEALVLEAMRNACFAVLVVERRHPSAGLIVTDMIRDVELWMVDEGLEMSIPDGSAFATRYLPADRFVMTAGAGVPIDLRLLVDALTATPLLLRRSQIEAVEDRRFAEAIYRTAIAEGVAEQMVFRDPAGTSDAA